MDTKDKITLLHYVARFFYKTKGTYLKPRKEKEGSGLVSKKWNIPPLLSTRFHLIVLIHKLYRAKYLHVAIGAQ